MKAFANSLLLFSALTVGQAHSAEPPPMVLRMPEGAVPIWRGITSEESAGNQNAMLYPAPNAAGFLAAIITHALIENGLRSSEQQARQADADKVLLPHAEAIDALTRNVLLAGVYERLSEVISESARGYVVEFQPAYALSQDRRTLVLDNMVRIYPAGDSTTTKFANVIRVVSTPCDAADPLTHWSANAAAELKREAVALAAHSLAIALAPQVQDTTKSFRTLRYRFGQTEKMERGQPVTSSCGRVVLRTLRESIMSVPVATDPNAPPCSEPYALAPG